MQDGDDNAREYKQLLTCDAMLVCVGQELLKDVLEIPHTVFRGSDSNRFFLLLPGLHRYPDMKSGSQPSQSAACMSALCATAQTNGKLHDATGTRLSGQVTAGKGVHVQPQASTRLNVCTISRTMGGSNGVGWGTLF